MRAVILLLAVILVFPWPLLVQGAACTPGTDCLCDCSKVPTGTFKNASCQAKGYIGDASALLMCEDFEAPTLTANVNVGGGPPFWGPPYDATGHTNDRGWNQYWKNIYGSGVNGSLWPFNTPLSPTFPPTCGFTFCSGLGVWHPTDLWQANNFAQMAILQNGQFASEVGTITPPTNTSTGTPGVFDGNQSMARRILAGNTSGLGSQATWTATRTFGVTYAVAYPNNSTASGVWAQPWKHNEFHPAGTGTGGDGLLTFHNQAGRRLEDPFEHFIFYVNGPVGSETQSGCTSKLAAATRTIGDFSCVSTALYFFADPSVYRQPADWPDETWGCVRGFYQNLGQTNTSIQIWFTPTMGIHAGVEQKIVDLSNMDTSLMDVANGIDGLFWDSYANTNQGDVGTTPTNQMTFRYEDNIYIRNGAPVSCAQIGFPPPPTQTLQLQGGALQLCGSALCLK